MGATQTPARARPSTRAPAHAEPDVTPRRSPAHVIESMRGPDLLIATSTLVLVALGIVMVYSASSAEAAILGTGPADLFLRQAIYAAIGLGGIWLILRIRLQSLAALSPLLLIASIGLLIAVLVPGIGTRVNGAQRWIDLGPISLQPSEFAKLALILWLGVAVARRPLMVRSLRGLLPIGAVLGLCVALVMLEPDLGTVLVMTASVVAVIILANAPRGLITRIVLGIVALAAIAIALAPYRRERLLAFLDPWADPGGSGFQTIQAQLAIGSGGISGRGLGEGMQKAFYLPEAHTDMIPATIGEELGLVGIAILLLGFLALSVGGFLVAARCENRRNALWAGAITIAIASQALINLGAALGVLPVTGVPLPLVSYGGSSLVVTMAMIGLLLRLGKDADAWRGKR